MSTSNAPERGEMAPVLGPEGYPGWDGHPAGADGVIPGREAAVSFVVIAYNECHSILTCLEAILAQDDGAAVEVIVVDDGSTDGTPDLVRGLSEKNRQVRLVAFEANRGRGPARAAGIDAARADLVAMVDSDVVIPPDWLRRARRALRDADAVGGIPVPDGDVTFIYNRFGLPAKACPPTITVSGTNGLYRRAVFDAVRVDARLTEGEDVALNRSMEAAGLRLASIPDLVVEHCESKGFGDSLRWRFESGVGATRQLARYHQVRNPDVAAAAELLALGAGAVGTVRSGRARWLGLPLTWLLVVSALHLHRKFEARTAPARFAGAVAVNAVMFAAYCVGRVAGVAVLARQGSGGPG